LISENIFLVPQSEIKNYYTNESYLYKVINCDKTFNDEEEDEVQQRLDEILRLTNKIEMRLNQQYGPLKIKKAPKKRNLPKSPDDIKLGDRCEIQEHSCVLKKSKGTGIWNCDMQYQLEGGCLSGYTSYVFYENGERMRCDNCNFDSCFKCSQFCAFKEIHRKAQEEDNEEEIVE
jgi:hypothetical protein